VFESQSYAVNGIRVGDHHIESMLVIHDRPKTHDTHVYIIKGISDLELGMKPIADDRQRITASVRINTVLNVQSTISGLDKTTGETLSLFSGI